MCSDHAEDILMDLLYAKEAELADLTGDDYIVALTASGDDSKPLSGLDLDILRKHMRTDGQE